MPLLLPAVPVPALPNPCDVPIFAATNPICQAAGITHAASQVIEFGSDPLGYIAQKLQQADAGLATTILPQLEKVTHPDLTATWFISAYRISFALAIFMWVAMLGWNFVQLGRRRVSGNEVVETLTVYTPAFFIGAMFGPALGTMFLTLTGALSDSLIGWGIGGSAATTVKALLNAIAAGDPTKIIGGAVVAIIFFVALLIALMLAFLVLLVMLVTLYLTGAVAPLSLVWLNNPRQRGKGMKVVMVWFGVNFSHVLLFLMLGIAFSMIAGMSTNFSDPGLQVLANLAVAVIVLFTATLSPLALLKFAPVGPTAASPSGPSVSVPSIPSQRRGPGSYPESDSDSQTAQMARDNNSPATDDDEAGEDGADGRAASGSASATSSQGAGSGGLVDLVDDGASAIASSRQAADEGDGASVASSVPDQAGAGSSAALAEQVETTLVSTSSGGVLSGVGAGAPGGASASGTGAAGSASGTSGAGGAGAAAAVGGLAGSAATGAISAAAGATSSSAGSSPGGPVRGSSAARSLASGPAAESSPTAAGSASGGVGASAPAGSAAGSLAGAAGAGPAPSSGPGGPAGVLGSPPAGSGVVPEGADGKASTAGSTAAGALAGDATAATAAAGARLEGAGEQVDAAAAVAEASGVAAPVGVGLQVLGDGLRVAGRAVSATAQIAQSAGDMAAEHMDHGEHGDHQPTDSR